MDNSNSTEKYQVLSFTILGEPASKANSRRIVKIGNTIRSIKSEKALNYADTFKQQCPKLDKPMTEDLIVTIKIYYASRRPDLDESLILDLMQGLVYENDRQVKEKHVYWGLDCDNPRTLISIRQHPVQREKKPPRRGAKEKDTGEKSVQK